MIPYIIALLVLIVAAIIGVMAYSYSQNKRFGEKKKFTDIDPAYKDDTIEKIVEYKEN